MATGQPPSFGELLKRYRVAAGLTQEQLARRAGLSERAVSDLERGVRRTPQPTTLQLLAGALGVTPAERAILETAVACRHALSARSRARPPAQAAGLTHVVGLPSQGAQILAPSALSPFVGRTHELALLEHHLSAVGTSSRSVPVLLLAGEPGIGKSRLLQEAAARAMGQGWAVLAAGCQRWGRQEPYAPLLDTLMTYVHARSAAQLRVDLQGCAWLVHLLPELREMVGEPFPAGTLPPAQERRLMFGAVGRFLANVAGPAGTLLVLDDLQRAGADALDLLVALVRSPCRVPLRVVGAYRDTEMQAHDSLAVMLADLAHAELVTHVTLGPLAYPDAARLLDDLLEGLEGITPMRREQVLQRLGGVPFFLVSWARALRAGALDGPIGNAVPWDLAQTIRQRVAALPEGAREVLGVAAVVGRRVPRALLIAMTGRQEEEVLRALDAACRVRLVEEEGADAYRFLHDVIREVVEADLTAARRTVLHRRLAAMLEPEAGECPVELGRALGGLSGHDRPLGSGTPGLVPQVTTVSDAQWAQIQPLLPPAARTGRRRVDDRRMLEAILYKLRSGCAWGDLPATLGDDLTAYRRLRRWQAEGLWEPICRILELDAVEMAARDRALPGRTRRGARPRSGHGRHPPPVPGALPARPTQHPGGPSAMLTAR